MNILFGILIGLFCLMFLVTAHEFGHFLMARRSGVKVLEFGICFPPRAIAWVHEKLLDENGKEKKGKNGKPIYKWRKLEKSEWGTPQKGLIFSLNYLPIGGFCQMDGESDADTRKNTFGAATFWQKSKILFGGVLTNWLVAFIIFTILAWTGMPTFLASQFSIESDKTVDFSPVEVVSVVENSPAARAGFKVGDKILSINNEPVYDSYDERFSSFAGEEVTYLIRRKSAEVTESTPYEEIPEEELTLVATLNEAGNEWGYLLGVSMTSDFVYSRYTWSAPIVGIGTTLQLTGETFKGVGEMLWNLITGTARQLSFNGETREEGREAINSAGEGVTGPVGIIGYIFPAYANAGPKNLAFLFALISVSLACMNVLPIPALDGGRWLMIFIARLKHKRLTKETEEKIVARAMIVLLGLMVLVTVLDITRFF